MASVVINTRFNISIHAPAGGATGDHDKTRLGQDHFNSRPCGRGDAYFAGRLPLSAYFNSRPCGRGDGLLVCGAVGRYLISIHAPAGGATAPFYAQLEQMLISIHAPAGGATLYSSVCHRGTKISIHAPAGGATLREKVAKFLDTIFQFTPLREGRQVQAGKGKSPHHLNTRPCGRGDNCGQYAECAYCRISIHAPAGGATLPDVRPAPGRAYFNSRPCGRGDGRSAFGVSAVRLFQFTPLREGRHPAL